VYDLVHSIQRDAVSLQQSNVAAGNDVMKVANMISNPTYVRTLANLLFNVALEIERAGPGKDISKSETVGLARREIKHLMRIVENELNNGNPPGERAKALQTTQKQLAEIGGKLDAAVTEQAKPRIQIPAKTGGPQL
jgi:hypothetical protein